MFLYSSPLYLRYLSKPSIAVQPSADDTPGINAAGKVIKVIVQNLSFELDCTQGVTEPV
jgi:hypothetical protein